MAGEASPLLDAAVGVFVGVLISQLPLATAKQLLSDRAVPLVLVDVGTPGEFSVSVTSPVSSL